MLEEWKEVPGYEGLYAVSTHGRVKSLRWGKDRLLTPTPNSQKYLIVSFRKDGIRKSPLVSRLVMLTFCPIENPGEMEVNHKDFNLTNNHISNLEWTSPRANIEHFLATGRKVGIINLLGEKHHLSVLTEARVIELRRLFEEGNHNCAQIAEMFNISHSTALQVIKGQSWKKLLPEGWTPPHIPGGRRKKKDAAKQE